MTFFLFVLRTAMPTAARFAHDLTRHTKNAYNEKRIEDLGRLLRRCCWRHRSAHGLAGNYGRGYWMRPTTHVPRKEIAGSILTNPKSYVYLHSEVH